MATCNDCERWHQKFYCFCGDAFGNERNDVERVCKDFKKIEGNIMNREILFRGKRFDNGDWIEGWVTSQFKKYTEGEFLTRIKSNVFGGGERLVDTETVGQYSGFIDINGKKIFEHDLCLCNRNINDRFDKTVFAIKYDKLIGFYGENEWGGNTISADEFDMCEIVGNVFDNPELLEVGK